MFSSTFGHEKAGGWEGVEIHVEVGEVKGVNENELFGAVAVEVAGRLFTGAAVGLGLKPSAPNTNG